MSVRSAPEAEPLADEYPTVSIADRSAGTASWRVRAGAGAVLAAVMLLRPSAPLFV